MADRNLVLQLLITAKDNASAVFSTLYSFLDRTTSATANLIREKFTDLFGGALAGAIDFEAAMSRVQAKAKATPADFARLKQAALDSGVAATQAAQALELLTGAGLSVDEAIAALTPTLRVMQNEQVSADVAARALTDTLSVMGMNLADTARAGDVLQASADATSTSVTALAEAIRTGGSGAVAAGLGFEQTITILTAFAKAGLQGSEAGTALRAVLRDLGDAAGKPRAELAKLGVTSGDVGEAVAALARAGATGQKAIKAFSEEAGPGLNALLQVGTKGLAEYQAQLNSAQGGLKTAADTIQNNTLGALDRLKNAWERVKLALTGPVLGPLADGARAFADQLTALASSGALQRFSESVVGAFRDAGTAALEFIKSVDWDGLSRNASATVQTLRTNIATMVTEVQGKVQTVADWTTTIFSPLTAAVDGYRLAWYAARGEMEKANAVRERLDQTSAAIDRALRGTSGELNRQASAAKTVQVSLEQLRAELQTATAQYERATITGEGLAAAQEALKQKTDAYRAALTAQQSAQQAATTGMQQTAGAATALGPALKPAADAAQQTAAALQQTAPAAQSAARGIAEITAGQQTAAPVQREYRDGANFVVRALGEQAAAAHQAAPVQERLTAAMENYGLSAQASKDRLTLLTEELNRVRQASDGWRSGLELNVVTLNSLRNTADATNERLALLTERQRQGLATDNEVAAAKQAANEAQVRYNQALEENVVQQERAVAAAERATQLGQQEADLYVQRAASALELARIKGDANEISRAETDLFDAQIAKITEEVVLAGGSGLELIADVQIDPLGLAGGDGRFPLGVFRHLQLGAVVVQVLNQRLQFRRPAQVRRLERVNGVLDFLHLGRDLAERGRGFADLLIDPVPGGFHVAGIGFDAHRATPPRRPARRRVQRRRRIPQKSRRSWPAPGRWLKRTWRWSR
ncbi:MAG: phage tail tape measure protein [Candidatus Contendobacter sp.]|nr:MAG: phage tail tape measure protein [Candidatus Contendobacter sp.]